MADGGDRKVATVLGLLGAFLIACEGLLDLVRGVVYLAVGRGIHALAPFDQGVIFLVVALLIVVFSAMGMVRREGRATVAGAVLVVLAIAGWIVLGFGSGLLAVLGSLLVLIAGVVFLVQGR